MFGSLQDWLVCTPVTSPSLNRWLNNQHINSSLWFTAWKVSSYDTLLLGLRLEHLACRNALQSKSSTLGQGSKGRRSDWDPIITSRAWPQGSKHPSPGLTWKFLPPSSITTMDCQPEYQKTFQIQYTVDVLWFTYYSWNKQIFSIIALV